MQENELINEYFTAANYIVLCQMYLNSYAEYNILNKIANLFLFKLVMETYQILLVINLMNKMKMVIPLQ